MMTQPILHNIKIMGMASELDALVKAIQKVRNLSVQPAQPRLKPLGSVLLSNESAGFGNALGLHRLAVPFEISLQLEGNDSG